MHEYDLGPKTLREWREPDIYGERKTQAKQFKTQYTARGVKKRDVTNAQWYLLGILVFLLIGAGIGVGIWFLVKSSKKDDDKNQKSS